MKDYTKLLSDTIPGLEYGLPYNDAHKLIYDHITELQLKTQDLYSKFFEQQAQLATTLIKEFQDKYQGQIGRVLTNNETFAIAFISGVRLQSDNKDWNELTPTTYKINLTTVPVAVCWDGSKFIVATKA